MTTPRPRLLLRWVRLQGECRHVAPFSAADAAELNSRGRAALARVPAHARAPSTLMLQASRLIPVVGYRHARGATTLWAGLCADPWPPDDSLALERLASRSEEFFSIACTYLNGE